MNDAGSGQRFRVRVPGRVAILLVVLLAAAVGAAAAEHLPFPLRLQDPVSGDEVSIEAGAPVLHLVFFASWCPPCVDELDRLAMLEARAADRGYRLVIVAVPTRQSRERLAAFAKRMHPPGRFLFDSDGTVQRACGADRIPTHLIVDRSGNVVLRAGVLDEKVRGAVSRLLGPGEGEGRRQR